MPDAGPDRPRITETCDPDFEATDCSSDRDCDNGCFCDGVERCEAGSCVAAGPDQLPCIDQIDCTDDVCLEELDRCFRQPQNDLCSDGQACNGFEICNPDSNTADARGCDVGVSLFCNDEDSCTRDSCEDDVGCIFETRDLDGDGVIDTRCGGEDCNDDPREGGMIFPGAREDCTNRFDDNCDGIRDFNDDTCAPTNDDCDSIRILPGPGLYSASTKLLSGDHPVSCVEGGVDAVFQFTVPSMLFPEADIDAVDVRFDALGVPSGAVAIRNADECASESPEDADIQCLASPSPSLLLRSLPPGDYVAIVNTERLVQSFDIRLDFAPPTPIPNYDVCNAETEVITESGVYEGRFRETNHDYEPTCGFGGFGGDRPDGAYRLVLEEPRDVTMTLSTESSSSIEQAVLAVYAGDCADLALEGVCVFGTIAEWQRFGLPAGEYFVVVEPSSVDAISWELEVELSEPIERIDGDACETAIDITDGSPKTVILDDLREDVGPFCGVFTPFGSTLQPRDAIFTFTLDEPQDIRIRSTGTGGWLGRTTHSIQLIDSWEECGLLRNIRACVLDEQPSIIRRSLPAGTYYVAVHTQDPELRSVTVQAEITEATPIPENDNCDGEVPEVCDRTIFVDPTATWVGFEDDYVGSSFSCPPRWIVSLDGVFKCTLEERRFLTAIVERRAPELSGSVYVRIAEGATCPGSGSDVACGSGSGVPATGTTSAELDPGTYWIVTETGSADAGDYTLRVINSPP